ncbi:MAG: 4-hydroxythreonine-4-phosphate dehydrogenase PdxA [Bacillota bacterium]|nr:4-hydroxythreonine-4-phosphate dehydrogenase PdxA [Bacillota bacterium]
MGDPAGIGPEIAMKVLAETRRYQVCRPFLIGSVQAASAMSQPDQKINPISTLRQARFEAGTVDVLSVGTDKPVKLGVVSAEAGRIAFLSVQKVIELALKGEIDATVTGPINKEALNMAGYHYSGHTEIYADLTQTKDYAMLLAHEDLRVIHVSTHVSLRQACDRVKKERVSTVIDQAWQICRDLGIDKPRIAVAGLNPHSSENGLFGWEEAQEIIPAIEEGQAKGYAVSGPVPPDTVFCKAAGGFYDIVVAMYHDQGHIPLKMAGFRWDRDKQGWDSVSGVNITLGLPIIRVSVDHGTAFDIAGRDLASPVSLGHAIDYALRLARIRSVRT